MKEDKQLLVIDGNAIVHRAYHALPPLTDTNGRAVSVVYGFFSMLLKVIEEVKPSYIIVCFDRPAPTFRKALFAGYQAQRPQMASELSEQIAILHAAIEEISIPIFEIDGYEADDLIGTISVQAKQQGVQSIILSGDRDLLQLVNSAVKVIMPITGITNMIIHDEKSVKEKYGITSVQFIDYKALIGDSSDGYPGVAGIGPKTASTLLQNFGTFENIYTHLGDIPPKIAEKLAIDAEQASLAKKLATIALDAPITILLDEAKTQNFTIHIFKKVFTEFGFDSLIKRVSQSHILLQDSGSIEGDQLGLL